MTNLLNEEIMAIKCTMAHLRRAIPLEPDYGKKKKMENSVAELNNILEGKLKECGDFKG